MRKTLAGIVLAIALTMGMTTTAFAATISPSASEAKTFDWSYVDANKNVRDVYPANVVTFGVEASESNPDADPRLTVDNLTVAENPDEITVNVPSYDTIGEYVYTITPSSSNSGGNPILGATYEPFQIRVLVTLDADRTKMVSTAYLANSAGSKLNGIQNPYGLGTLTITQNVTGNYGDPNKAFSMIVTLDSGKNNVVKNEITYVVNGVENTLDVAKWSSETYRGIRIELQNGQQAVFTNIPEGMKYRVEVDNYTGSGYTNAVIDYSDGAGNTLIKDGDKDTATITIGREAAIPTGVFLDNMPIVMAAAVAVSGAIALLALKRRRANR